MRVQTLSCLALVLSLGAAPALAQNAERKPAATKKAAAKKAAEPERPGEAPAVVLIESSRAGATVLCDGKPVGKTPVESALKLPAGKHELVLQAAPTDPSSGARVVIELRAGERRIIDLSPRAAARFLEPPGGEPPPPAQRPPEKIATAPMPTAAPVAAPVTPSDGPTPIYKRWWFWAGVGAGVVLVVGLGAGLGARKGDDSGIAASPTWPGGTIDGRAASLRGVEPAGLLRLSFGGSR